MASAGQDVLATARQQILQVSNMIDVQGEGEHRGGSSSASKLIATIVPLLIVFIPMILTFFYLRQKQIRIYAPRTFLDVLKDEEKTPKPAFGMFNWISAFRNLGDDFALNHQSLDNYLFVRYLRMLSLLSFVGTLITWVVLLPVNSMGGKDKPGLDKFTFSNVSDPTRYYWHAICAWIFLLYVMYIITRETLYYINLRQAYLTTPRNVARISTRVVLFTGVPEDLRHERWIKADYQGVKRVWVATDCTELETLVQTMNDAAMNLESAEINLSTMATKKHLRGEKHFASDPERQENPTNTWISLKERKYKQTIPLLSRKIDAIGYYRDQLSTLVPQVERLQQQHIDGDKKQLPAIFVEFESQRAAQTAYSAPFWKQPGNIEPACIGLASPIDINWENLAMSKTKRWARTLAANAFIVVLIVFWSVPVGIVGTLADIDYLANSIPALSFLNNLSASVKSLISGLLPTVLISALLALVPIICRFVARKAGSVTLAQVELTTQAWYFAFQVVQVFLITTFSSGASTVAKQIWDEPTQAPTLLAENLPKAATFYLSFFVLQGIAVAASTIFQIGPFLVFNLLAPFLDKTPRQKLERWITLSSLSWGSTYPKFTLFAVIAIAYSCIAPLVLGFATFGLFFLYLAFRYNVFYVLSTAVDTKGDVYGRALQHLSVGVYLAELCLIGLMTARGADGPTQLMVVLLILTIIYQTYLYLVLTPLANTLSDELMAEDEAEALAEVNVQGDAPVDGSSSSVQPKQPNQSTGYKIADLFFEHSNRGGLFAPFLYHGSRSSYPRIHQELFDAFPGQPVPNLPEEVVKHAYHHPAITAKPPRLWIVRDELGVSVQEIKESKKVIDITDEGATFDEKGNIDWAQENVRDAPIWKERVEY